MTQTVEGLTVQRKHGEWGREGVTIKVATKVATMPQTMDRMTQKVK